MKVLVTGANGLLGAHVVRELLCGNFQVRVLVRKESDLMALEGLDLECHFGQITVSEDVNKAVAGCEFVIHAAARTSQASSDVEHFRLANIESTKYIMDACEKYKVKRLVFVSTANCFGNGTMEKPGNESTPFLPWLKNSGYAYSKLLAQKMVLAQVKTKQLDAVVVNPTFLIGAQDFKPSSGQIFGHVLNKRLAFYPPGGKNFVDVEMAARGVVSAMENGRKGECYLLAGENYSYRDFFKLVQKVNNKKRIFIPIPKLILVVAGIIGDLAEKVLGVPVVLTKANAKMLCLGNYFSSEKAIKDLKIEKVPIEESIEKAILWFRENGYFKS